MKNKSYMPSMNRLQREWHFVDAEGAILGKLATNVARILMGKTKPTYTPNENTGDVVVITNAEKVIVTGKKLTDKVYYWHTGFPKGLRSETLGNRLQRDPVKVIHNAVRGMLPKNRLRAGMLRNLYIYKGGEHPHTAQQKGNK